MSLLEKKVQQTTFLIVDDQEFYCLMLCDMLRGLGGYDSHKASNGQEAIEMMETLKPDIVITDLNMAPVDGFALARWIRRSPASPKRSMPIIVLTARKDAETIVTARDHGVSELLVKPVVPKQVVSRLHSVFFEPRPFIEEATYVGPCRRRRKDPEYNGEFRRYDDPLEIREMSTESIQAGNNLNRQVMRLVEQVAHFKSGSAAQVETLLSEIYDLKRLALQLNFPPTAKAVQALETYVAAVGEQGEMNRSLLRDHLECIAILSDPRSITDSHAAEHLERVRQHMDMEMRRIVAR